MWRALAANGMGQIEHRLAGLGTVFFTLRLTLQLCGMTRAWEDIGIWVLNIGHKFYMKLPVAEGAHQIEGALAVGGSAEEVRQDHGSFSTPTHAASRSSSRGLQV